MKNEQATISEFLKKLKNALRGGRMTEDERDKEVSDHIKPICSPEEVEEMGKVEGYFRAVKTEFGNVIEMKMSAADFIDTMLKCMDKHDDLEDIFKEVIKRREFYQTPAGKLVEQLKQALGKNEICGCPKCTRKRKEAEKLAKEN